MISQGNHMNRDLRTTEGHIAMHAKLIFTALYSYILTVVKVCILTVKLKPKMRYYTESNY